MNMQDRLIWGIHCKSPVERFPSWFNEKWIWGLGKLTILESIDIIKSQMLFTYNKDKPLHAKPIPISWFKKEIEKQILLGYEIEIIEVLEETHV